MSVEGPDAAAAAAMAIAATETQAFEVKEEANKQQRLESELPLEEELGKSIAMHLQGRRKQLLAEHGGKLSAFAADLDSTGAQLLKQCLVTTRAVLKGTKHDDTVRKAMKHLQTRTSLIAGTEAPLTACEKQLTVHPTIRIASADTIPFKLAIIASNVKTVAQQKQVFDDIALRLTHAMEANPLPPARDKK